MSPSISPTEFQLMRGYIEQECGISMGQDKSYLVESRLAMLVAESGCDTYNEFYLKLKSGANPGLKTRTIDALTTNETLWFRDTAPYVLLQERLLPEASQRANQAGRPVRIWSAACSTGQEPYSIAMITHEYVRNGGDPRLLQGNLHILATDISSAALMLARSGRFDEIAMGRGMMPGFRERYFLPDTKSPVLRDEIKKMVQFQQLNLQSSFLALGLFDVIFLRNVAIYFSQSFKTALFERIYHALYPGGVLILGASESLTGIPNEFMLKEHGRALYYQKKN